MSIKDHEGKTALRLANEIGNEEIIAFFDPEERKRNEYIHKLELENAQLIGEVKVLNRTKEDLQTKLVDIFKRLHQTEQNLIGLFSFIYTFIYIFLIFQQKFVKKNQKLIIVL